MTDAIDSLRDVSHWPMVGRSGQDGRDWRWLKSIRMNKVGALPYMERDICSAAGCRLARLARVGSALIGCWPDAGPRLAGGSEVSWSAVAGESCSACSSCGCDY